MKIASFSKLSEEFVVQFDFFANNLGTNKQNMIHMTDDLQDVKNGLGIPAVWLIGGDLDVCMSFNNTSNVCKKIGIEIQKWHTLKISQRKNGTGYFTFDITLDNVLKRSIPNEKPQVFENVKLFTSNDIDEAFDGNLKNIRVYPTGNNFHIRLLFLSYNKIIII